MNKTFQLHNSLNDTQYCLTIAGLASQALITSILATLQFKFTSLNNQLIDIAETIQDLCTQLIAEEEAWMDFQVNLFENNQPPVTQAECARQKLDKVQLQKLINKETAREEQLHQELDNITKWNNFAHYTLYAGALVNVGIMSWNIYSLFSN